MVLRAVLRVIRKRTTGVLAIFVQFIGGRPVIPRKMSGGGSHGGGRLFVFQVSAAAALVIGRKAPI
jgi:hypothetical protein